MWTIARSSRKPASGLPLPVWCVAPQAISEQISQLLAYQSGYYKSIMLC